MRIAFITPEFVTEESYSGGLANYLGRVTVALADHGHDVHVFTRSMESGSIDFQGVQVHRVVPWWDKRHLLDHFDRFFRGNVYGPYQDLKAAKALHQQWKQVHRKTPFDCVQVANVMAVGFFFRFTKSPPVITRLSSFRPAWDTAAGVQQSFGVRLRGWMEKSAIRGTRHYYAPTHFVASRTSQAYKLNSVEVIETPYFHDKTDDDLSVYQAHLSGKQYVLFFGRMTQMKGVHMLAPALAKIMTAQGDLHAVFVGNDAMSPDGDSMKDFVKRALADWPRRVTVLDSIRHDQLYPILKNARVVALPSLIDNLPNTCLEAMAHGRTVVATRGSCFEQLIEDGVSGFMAKPDDVEDLAAAITTAWQLDPAERTRVGENARKRIALLHPDLAIPKLIDYYQRICGIDPPRAMDSSINRLASATR
jgi:glycosyltransferase involved in cell wall biosynthesis